MTPFTVTVVFYFIVLFMCYQDRPNKVFARDGSLQPFGIGKNKTIFTPATIAIIVSLIVQFVYLNITFILKFKNKLYG